MYLVFDLLYLNKEDLMGLPLVRRREILKKLLPKERPIRFSDAIEGRGIEFFRAAQAISKAIVLQRDLGFRIADWGLNCEKKLQTENQAQFRNPQFAISSGSLGAEFQQPDYLAAELFALWVSLLDDLWFVPELRTPNSEPQTPPI
jgi:ATP dependent DNA ligase-like protein